MQYLEADGLQVSRLGLGTWQFGSREWGYGEAYASDVAPALVRRALELGITMLDTAEMYGFGRSERIIRGALAVIPEADRTGLTVATKLMPMVPAERVVAWQAAGSRRRLGVDVLDLYYLHWPNPIASARRTMQAVRPLLASGVVHRIGVSNYSLDRWRESERALRSPLIANQVRFSLVSPGPAADLVPYAAEHGRLVVAYSPLAQGLLARAGESAQPLPGFRAMNAPAGARSRRIAALATAVREIAAAHGATPAQVALAWVIHHPNTVAIPGARTVDQLEENVAAADLVLTDDEFTRLTSETTAFAADRRGHRRGSA